LEHDGFVICNRAILKAENGECLFFYSKALFITTLSIESMWPKQGTQSVLCDQGILKIKARTKRQILTGHCAGQGCLRRKTPLNR